ncbi:MAG: tyrosine-type recombinase/integrase, partial [Actinomycetota bacterium]|nr:tyrosine-type recombinase/integrase [Actinomycetota bacterium]
LRWGEAAALRRRHVNTLHGRIDVEDATEELGDRLAIGTPKDHQRRSVHLPAFAWREVQDHLDHHAPEDPDALVFGTSNGTAYWNSDFRRRYFKPAVHKAGLPPRLTPHGLRHSCASLWRAAGARVEEVRQQLGHAKASITLDTYTHLFQDRPDSVLDRLDQRHGGGPRVAQMLPKDDDDGVVILRKRA